LQVSKTTGRKRLEVNVYGDCETLPYISQICLINFILGTKPSVSEAQG